jgi:hypothetical protein
MHSHALLCICQHSFMCSIAAVQACCSPSVEVRLIGSSKHSHGIYLCGLSLALHLLQCFTATSCRIPSPAASCLDCADVQDCACTHPSRLSTWPLTGNV